MAKKKMTILDFQKFKDEGRKFAFCTAYDYTTATIVDESDVDSDRISIGCRVTVTNLDNGKQLPEYTIVGSQEANVMERKVSEDSPFGKALMGTKAGDQITVEAPRGVIHYRVDTIER